MNFIDLPVDRIRVPANRARRYDCRDDRVKSLIESIRREGIRRPILVRKDGDAFLLVAGRKRFMAVRFLGHQTIPAEVISDSSDERGIRERLDRVCRDLDLLSPDGRVLGLDAIVSAYVALYETPPGTKPGVDHKSAPASGETKRSAVADDLRIAEAFSAEQLASLSPFNLTTADLLRIANLGSKTRIAAVVAEVALHGDVERAIRETEPMPVDSLRVNPAAEDDLSDAEWLKTCCSPIRGKLQVPAAFDQDALFWRRFRDARRDFWP